MADKKGIFRSPGDIVFNGDPIINSSEELRINDDKIIINNNQAAGTATLQLSHGTANATVSWEGNVLTTSAPIAGSLTVTDAGGDGSLAYNDSTGVLTYTGPSAAEVRAHFSGSTGITLSSGAISITNSGVSAATYGSATAVPQVAVNAQGQITSASSVNIAIPHTQVTDFNAEARALLSVSGDLAYNSTTGVFSFTERTDAEVRGLISATESGTNDGSIAYNSSTGVITYTGPTPTQLREHFAGDSGQSIGYDKNNGAFSILSTVEKDITFNGALRANTVAGSDSSTHVATTAWVQSNAPGTLTDVYAGDGITATPANITSSGEIKITNTGVGAGVYGDANKVGTFTVNSRGQLTAATNVAISITSSAVTNFTSSARGSLSQGDGIDYTSGTGSIAVDGSVVRRTGNQTISGTKTFDGTVIVPALTMPSASGGNYVAGDNSTKAASTAYVETAITSLIDGAPGTLNTLNELAAALNDDASAGT